MRTCYGDLNIVVKGAKATIARAEQQPTAAAGCPVYRSKLEADYAHHLMALQYVKVVTRWYYEPVRFRLAKAVSYRPDFFVQEGSQLTFREVKGYHKNLRDSLTHLKVAAGMYPCFTFLLVTKEKGQWVETPV